MTKENWPKMISKNENSEYIKKIKPEYIISAEFERNDPYYEKVAEIWFLSLDLNINGQESHVFITDQDLVKEYDEILSKSEEFTITEDKRPEQYGKYTYSRK